MAKESMKAREVKRAKLVARYAEKRAALKQIVRTGTLDLRCDLQQLTCRTGDIFVEGDFDAVVVPEIASVLRIGRHHLQRRLRLKSEGVEGIPFAVLHPKCIDLVLF